MNWTTLTSTSAPLWTLASAATLSAMFAASGCVFISVPVDDTDTGADEDTAGEDDEASTDVGTGGEDTGSGGETETGETGTEGTGTGTDETTETGETTTEDVGDDDPLDEEGGEVCSSIEAAYNDLISMTQCEVDEDCAVVQGHCDVGLGGCHYLLNASVDAQELDALAGEWEDHCPAGGLSCVCEPPPEQAICDAGQCVPADVEPCAPMDAIGIGECDAFFGVAWNGDECVSLSGCECVGADCGLTYPDVSACEAANALCEPEGLLRVIHVFDIDMDGDVGIDDQPPVWFFGVSQGASSDYASLSAGAHTAEVYPSGSLTPWISTAFELFAGRSHTLAIGGAFPLTQFVLIDDDSEAIEADHRRVRFAHMHPGVAGPVDLWSMGPAPVLVAEQISPWSWVSLDLSAVEDQIGVDLDADGIPDLTYALDSLGLGTGTNLFMAGLDGDSLTVQFSDSSTAWLFPS